MPATTAPGKLVRPPMTIATKALITTVSPMYDCTLP
jgi:hypothetical protein